MTICYFYLIQCQWFYQKLFCFGVRIRLNIYYVSLFYRGGFGSLSKGREGVNICKYIYIHKCVLCLYNMLQAKY